MLNRNYKKVIITDKGVNEIKSGHNWVFYGEIVSCDDEIQNGDIVDIYSKDNKYTGTGFYNNNSKITLRILTRDANITINEDFFIRRINYAWNYRKQVMKDDLNSVRIIHGESDGFPGLTVDKFNDILVCQILSLGIEKNKDLILPNIKDILIKDGYYIKGIYERNDVHVRALEGMEENKCWYYKENDNLPTTTIIEENGLKYNVDFENGQKTGYFLDQKYNRLFVRNIANGLRVLDCCTHTGSFAMNATSGNAKSVVASDISRKALVDAEVNFKLNNLNIKTIEADCFELLRKLVDEKNHDYDLIILDPPAFTKSRKTINNAMKGYTELNYLAMRLLPRGGYLVTASCSHFATLELFSKSIKEAARMANVSLKQIIVSGASYDHPVLWGNVETEYLHFLVFQIV